MLLRRFILVAILLVATALRVVGLDNFPTPLGASPPGLEHDEVAHWLINRAILAGEHAVYFPEAYGHEALYHYAQAYFGAAVGDHALALRLPSAYLGVLLVAVSYALGRRLFGVRLGLLSAAFLAVLFWPVFYSRLALRAIALPVVAGLSAIAWWRAYSEGQGERGMDSRPSHAPLLFLLSGALAGLSLHTYMAARAVPIFYALYCLYLAGFHRAAFRTRWRGIVAFWLALAAVALPLAAFLLLNPGAEARIGEVDAPLRALLAGDPRLVLSNAAQIAAGFGLRGDPLWRQGIAGRPVFDPVLGLLFYAGVALCLWRWREPRHAFLLLWLGASVIPSLVTVDAPSTIRMIGLLPVLMLFPILGGQALVHFVQRSGKTRQNESVKQNPAQLIHLGPQLSTLWTRLSTDLITALTGGVLVLLLLYHAWATIDGVWRVWPANDEVQFVWQAALTEAGAHLDAAAEAGPVAVGGWTPDTMDPPTMELSLRRDDLALGFFNPTESLLLPDPGGGAARLVRPAILPLAPELERLTGPWTVLPDEAAAGRQFAIYRYEAMPAIRPAVAADVVFGGEVRFLGYDPGPTCADPTGPCKLTTYWRVLAPTGLPRRFFLHLIGADGAVLAQADRLGAPAEHWRAGDVIVQLLTLPRTDGELRLGVYDPTDGGRLMTEAGDEYFVVSGQ
ncbi:MAG: glycosyltransferase family 39 protein [Candidatus Promineofilum sp.]|nr:glycosyltransferase family 39 protein [Promineifilum sp.]